MKFSEFEHRLLKLKNKSLPGIKSHIELVPIDRLKSIKEEVKIAKKDAAVSLCFFPDSNYETRLPFILRNNYEGVHSNQISFPGGKKEKLDEDLIETARRETNEEISLNKDEMKLQFKLTDIYIPPSNFLVRPYVFKIENEPEIKPNTDEVVKERMSEATAEITHWAEYDYVIINEDLNLSVKTVLGILHSERMKRIRQVGLGEFVRSISLDN